VVSRAGADGRGVLVTAAADRGACHPGCAIRMSDTRWIEPFMLDPAVMGWIAVVVLTLGIVFYVIPIALFEFLYIVLFGKLPPRREK
jgi:hypothetical protein